MSGVCIGTALRVWGFKITFNKQLSRLDGANSRKWSVGVRLDGGRQFMDVEGDRASIFAGSCQYGCM